MHVWFWVFILATVAIPQNFGAMVENAGGFGGSRPIYQSFIRHIASWVAEIGHSKLRVYMCCSPMHISVINFSCTMHNLYS